MYEVQYSIKIPKKIFLDLSSKKYFTIKSLFEDITDINQENGCSKFEIEKLDISRNRISNINDLKNYIIEEKLKEFYCSENCIEFLGVQLKFPELKILDCSYNKVPVLNNLVSVVGNKLKILNLEHTGLLSVEGINKFTELEILSLKSNNIFKIQDPINLKNLRILDISQNNLSECNALKDLIMLQTLDISKNILSNISFISELVNLENLNIGFNKKIISLSGIERLEKITEINFEYCNIYSLSELSGKNKLRKIVATFNKINSYEEIFTMESLEELYLQFNKIDKFYFLNNNSTTHMLNATKDVIVTSHIVEQSFIKNIFSSVFNNFIVNYVLSSFNLQYFLGNSQNTMKVKQLKVLQF